MREEGFESADVEEVGNIYVCFKALEGDSIGAIAFEFHFYL